MNISAITKFWNDYLSEWDIDPIAKMHKEKVEGRFFTKSKILTNDILYMPEPYYGDTDNPYCVIIDLNPGLSHKNDPEKLHGKTGFIYQCLHANVNPNHKYNPCYSAVNAQYSPFLKTSIASIGTVNEIPGAAWWKNNRISWVNSFLGLSKMLFEKQPLALELCPWHSKTWSNNIVSGMNFFLFDKVVEPAAEAIRKGDIGFGFCFGKIVGDILLDNNFAICKIWDKNNPVGKWPCTKNGVRCDRTYRLLKGQVNGEKVYFLNLYASGTFNAPGKEFRKDVEPLIIQELRYMGFFNNHMNMNRGPFRTYRDKLTEEQRRQNVIRETSRILKLDSKKNEEEILKAWPSPIIPVAFDNPIWSKIQECHLWHWKYFFNYKNDRMFVYHLGLANLAEHISEVKEENIRDFQQLLVYLQFGKDYPNIINGFHQVMSYPKFIKCEKDFVSEIKDTIKDIGKNEYLPGINITDGEWESLTYQYVDGCIRILLDLTGHLALNGVVFSDIPKVFDVNRNRYKTLGDFLDDYLTKLNAAMNL